MSALRAQRHKVLKIQDIIYKETGRINRMKRLMLLLITCLMFTGCSVHLQDGLNEDQANEIVVTLRSHGIPAEKIQTGTGQKKQYAVTVVKSKATEAWEMMKENDLPAEAEKGFDEIYGKGSLVPSATEEQALFLKGLQGEIAETIRTIDGVVRARVHVVLPAESLFGDEKEREQPKAAVFIKYVLRGDKSLPFKESELKALVAGSIKGLQTKDVEVMVQEISAFKENQLYEPVRFGPFTISRNSVRDMKIMIGFISIVVIVLGMIIFIQAQQLRRSTQ
ncbi:MAG: EscJ/YscJ/HrcJ family type III secretion inner membrane ring protein [Candidatus Fischerbacteria bacterium RBG_13_37_8]|uniref:EscJ/YscJ/HrcJ family type III secretion inner membrane ring protein n=1 Tax=Candidatus Fischerbacteria bacterium RBG_13_37_8 TaxID=1817863 RepID=A0A1F5VQV0_9BACT|nr:MAG: EscJ/YscJ/HrcJ family type III secretion inner membrane ring protein [Candidatus Fischerbacteria bacterium RBG_13_37_8]